MAEIKNSDCEGGYTFSVLLRNKSISAELEPVLSHAEKLCVASN